MNLPQLQGNLFLFINLYHIIRANGALGSRLTGAGWGGCTVSLVPKEKLKHFVSQLKSLYYSKRNVPDNEEAMQGLVFSSEPGSGASVIKL